MPAPRFYCPTPLAPDSTIELPPALAHHAVRVLRLKPDTEIVLFDGLGGQYPSTLRIEGKRAYALTGACQPTDVELPGHITLAQGIPSSDKMDWVIEKAVELGAARLIPIEAQRSVLQLGGDRLRKRMEHWRRVAQSASEQCGRNRLMDITEPLSLAACLADRDADTQTLFCHPEAALSLPEALDRHTLRIRLLVGPEGGWSPQEQTLVEQSGLTPVRFGHRVLRTETAGLALISAVSALRGWE
jgi:16S rRNA (uracil1498-N3)-methyltransferase